MAKKQKEHPTTEPSEDDKAKPFRLAKSAVEKIKSDPVEYDEIIRHFANEVETLDGHVLVGDVAFGSFERFLKEINHKGLLRDCKSSLSRHARLSHWRRLRAHIADLHVVDALIEMDSFLDRLPLNDDLRWAVEKVKKDCEVEIEGRKKRATIKAELEAIERTANDTANNPDSIKPEPEESDQYHSEPEGVCRTCGKGENYPDRNREVVTLILNDIFDNFGIKPKRGQLTVEDYARAIGFLTGYSFNTTKRIINDPYDKGERNRNAYDKDNDIRRQYLKDLGLHDLANKVQ